MVRRTSLGQAGRGQLSFEYILIIGMALLIIVPSIMFFLRYSQGSKDAVTHNRVQEIGLAMTKSAAEAYALGKSSWLTLEVNMPAEVEGVYASKAFGAGFAETELVINYRTQQGVTTAVFYPPIPIVNATESAEDMNVISERRQGIVRYRFSSLGNRVAVALGGDS